MSVAIQSEIREGDELNNNQKYAIYTLTITLDGRDSYEISRRFSQFHELMDQLIKDHAAVKEIPFPPRKLLGNLAPKTVEKRATELQEWVNALLAHSDDTIKTAAPLLAFIEATEGMVKVGATGPSASFADIHGRVFDPATYGSDWLLIYSVASRDNSGALTKFMTAAGDAITAKYPSLKQIFVNVANLVPVPDKMKGVVTPIISKMHSSNTSKLMNSFTKNCPGAYNGQDMFFHADYSGEVIDSLGCSDSNWSYRVFIVAGGTIIKSFQSSTPNAVETYTAAIDEAVQQFPAVLAPWPAAEDGTSLYGETTKIAEEQIKIAPRKAHCVDVEITEPSLVGWQLKVLGNSSHLDFSISKKNADESTVAVLPKRTVECGENPYCQVCHLMPGAYVLELDNKGSTLKSKEVEFAAVKTNIIDTA
jgi:hypothetical protein